MRKGLDTAGMEIEVFSRGLLAIPNRHPPSLAQQVAREFGVDISRHLAQPLLHAETERAGMILVMNPSQRRRVAEINPASIGKIFLLSQPRGGGAIEDPIGGDADTFRRVYAQIVNCVDAWLQRFGVN